MPDYSIHFVYIISAIENDVPVAPCKIGITSNLVSRLSGIQTGNHKKLEIISAIPIPSREVVCAIESALHEHFSEFRLHGEWFDVCPVDAAIGICTLAHDAFQVIVNDNEKVHEALSSLGITNEINQCFAFIKYCERKGLPLATRFKGDRDGPNPNDKA